MGTWVSHRTIETTSDCVLIIHSECRLTGGNSNHWDQNSSVFISANSDDHWVVEVAPSWARSIHPSGVQIQILVWQDLGRYRQKNRNTTDAVPPYDIPPSPHNRACQQRIPPPSFPHKNLCVTAKNGQHYMHPIPHALHETTMSAMRRMAIRGIPMTNKCSAQTETKPERKANRSAVKGFKPPCKIYNRGMAHRKDNSFFGHPSPNRPTLQTSKITAGQPASRRGGQQLIKSLTHKRITIHPVRTHP